MFDPPCFILRLCEFLCDTTIDNGDTWVALLEEMERLKTLYDNKKKVILSCSFACTGGLFFKIFQEEQHSGVC